MLESVTVYETICVVSCEADGCNTKLYLKSEDHNNIAATLQKHGWSGNERQNHTCGKHHGAKT